MPSAYAHYRFGVQVLPSLPADIRSTIDRNRPLFDAGLMGPDPLFFYRPYTRSKVAKLASKYHYQTGRAFFSRVCGCVKTVPEEGYAYLYGVLGHYCLDSLCHPFIHEMTDSGSVSHNELESEFERYLLNLDGIEKPHAYHRGKYLRLRKTQCVTPASFYPPLTVQQFHEALNGMNLTLYLLSGKTELYHRLTKGVLQSMGGQNPGLLMHWKPNRACQQYNEHLLSLYQKAVSRFPGYLENLRRHMIFGDPLDDRFEAVFG